MGAVTTRKAPWRFPRLSDPVQEFFLCILFHMLLPFVPLVAEIAVLGRVEKKTVLLFLAIYLVSLGVSSHSRLMFGATIVFGLMYSMFFGLAAAGGDLAAPVIGFGYLILTLGMLFQAAERYNRHVVEQDRFWEFTEETKQ